MVDILRRSVAPVSDRAWAAIEEEAVRTLKGNLSARALVDMSGPHGWEMAAVNLGRLDLSTKPQNGVHWGTRKVLPLVEIRIPFFLKMMEIDSITRGCSDPELSPVHEAARKAAIFEERAVYNGIPKSGIDGILKASPHKPIAVPGQAAEYVDKVEDAVKALQVSGIGGPYALVLGTEPYVLLRKGSQGGYPLPKRVKDLLLGGDILWSPALEGGVLVSTRGGDFELTVGLDLAIGYADHDRDEVELYLTESFTFRVVEPAAAIGFAVKKKG